MAFVEDQAQHKIGEYLHSQVSLVMCSRGGAEPNFWMKNGHPITDIVRGVFARSCTRFAFVLCLRPS